MQRNENINVHRKLIEAGSKSIIAIVTVLLYAPMIYSLVGQAALIVPAIIAFNFYYARILKKKFSK